MSQFRFASVWRDETTDTITHLLKYEEMREFFNPHFRGGKPIEIKETIITTSEYYSTAHEMVEYQVSTLKMILYANCIVLVAKIAEIMIITSIQLRAPEYPQEKEIDHVTPLTLFGAPSQILQL